MQDTAASPPPARRSSPPRRPAAQSGRTPATQERSPTPSPGRRRSRRKQAGPDDTSDVSFMHGSEQEFAKLLDYYGVPYLYEPRSFPLRWDGNRVVEMFSPDFYLPEQDQYFELTTMKQNLVTTKNRKLRQLRELYPEINIQLLYRRDYVRLLGRYGYGPLSEAEVKGIARVLYTREEIAKRVTELAQRIKADYAGESLVLIGVLRGAFVFISDLIRAMDGDTVELAFMSVSRYRGEHQGEVDITRDIDLNIEGRHVVLVQGLIDTGMTLRPIVQHVQERAPASIEVCAMFDKRARRVVDIDARYIGFEVPDEFVVGYGLDYNEHYRNLPYLASMQVVEPKIDAQR